MVHKLRMLELFAGTSHMSKAFKENGFDVVSVDLDERFKDCIHEDAYQYLQEHGDWFDVIWASPDCRTYSIAQHCHRDKQYNPLTEYAKYCDEHNTEMMDWFREHKDSIIFFVENPTGRMRHMPFMHDVQICTTTFCRYGHKYRKSTDIWTNCPEFSLLPPCKAGWHCHTNSQSGNSDLHGPARAAIPDRLCYDILRNVRNAVEKYPNFGYGMNFLDNERR